MKRVTLKVVVFTLIAMFFASCQTINIANRESVNLPPIKLKRADYKITEDASADVEITLILGGLIKKGYDAKNIKQGRYEGWNGNFQEKMAVYNLLEKHPEWDYLTNVRFVESYTQKIFSKTWKVKVIAKGVILKTDK
jgi:hypothetical protein